MKDTILIDFDGVIRHWSGTEVKDTENRLGLENGTLFSWAFSHPLLFPAITGVISHEEWMERVKAKLAHLYDDAIADQLMAAWQAASWEIDVCFLQDLKQLMPTCQLVLVTNATSRLASDLNKAGLEATFDAVINSSQIQVAKPEHRFFEKALSMAGSQADRSVFIDDSLDNVQAARAMGIDSIHHNNAAKTLELMERRCTSSITTRLSHLQ